MKNSFEKTWLQCYSLIFLTLVVAPAYRHQKIGEELIIAAKQHAVQLGYTTLYLLTFDQTIPDWYRKLGWEIVNTEQALGRPVTIMRILLKS